MQSESERNELVMELVSVGLEQSPETREIYLRSACAGDAGLFAEVEERLEWEQRMGDFLCQPVVEVLDLLDRPFEPGELVAGRFRVINEAGRGGMGVVYEAHDEKLDCRVALKTAVRGHDNRLTPETVAARKVSHPNVCKVYELHSAGTEFGEVKFLTMEFIEGETLSARIQRTGSLPPEEARDIAFQISEGLSQAHHQGVIHRDLKCSNVILPAEPDGRTRAVITDFGLASLELAGRERGGMSGLRGSLDYMAPELFSGAGPSVASDLYALGVIFHEMLTGKPPLPAEESAVSQSASTATLHRATSLHPAERRCETLPWRWRKIVARCLETDPLNRFVSMDEVIARLEAIGKRRWLLAVSAAAMLVIVGLGVIPEKPGPAVRLAVLPIAVEGEPLPAAAGLGVELADRLSGARRGFVVIPPRDALRNRVDTPEKAKKALTATHVLQTRIRNSGGQMMVEASVIETNSNLTFQELRGTYHSSEIALVAKALTATVTGAFRLRARVPMEVLAAAAYADYVQGISLLRRDDVSADEAMPFFQKAIEQDPGSALPYAGLAEAQLQKSARFYGGEWLNRATQSLAKAQSLNADAVPVLLAAGLLKRQRGWYDQAALDYSRAVELAPENSEAWKRLADVNNLMNRPDEAVTTYQQAIRFQPDYYAPYYALGRFYLVREQYREAEALFRRVIELAPGLAAGRIGLGLAQQEQMRLSEAEQSLLTALHLQETAPVLTDLGWLYYAQERYGEAAQYFEKSVNAQPPTALRYADLGDAYRQLGRVREAADAYRQAQSLAASEIVENPIEPSARANLAYVSARLGERSEAEFEIRQAVAIGPSNTTVLRLAVFTFEALGEHEQTLKLLAGAPRQLLEKLSRQPELRSLQQDPNFQKILTTKVHQ